MNLSVDVIPDFANGIMIVALRGDLDVHSAPTARTALMKCFAQYPDRIIVDLAGLRVDARARLALFPAVVRANGPSPTVLILCGASQQLAPWLGGRVLGGLAVYPTRAEALRAATGASLPQPVRRVSTTLSPALDAPAAARSMVGDACRAWGIDHLREPATIVISELVSNAVRHAGTKMDVVAYCPRDYLRLSVRDGSHQRPVMTTIDTTGCDQLPESGRGLTLIDICAARWGYIQTGDGKVVWAILRATPVTGQSRNATFRNDR